MSCPGRSMADVHRACEKHSTSENTIVILLT
jgi:hypothetical protein